MRLSDSDISGLIQEAKSDEVGLWLIVATIRHQFGVTDSNEVREIALDAMRRLLASGEVKAGNYLRDRSGRVQPWGSDHPEILARIEREWDQLGRDPNFAEVVVRWLRIGHQTRFVTTSTSTLRVEVTHVAFILFFFATLWSGPSQLAFRALCDVMHSLPEKRLPRVLLLDYDAGVPSYVSDAVPPLEIADGWALRNVNGKMIRVGSGKDIPNLKEGLISTLK